MADNYRTTLSGLKVLKDNAVPSVFPWKTPVNQCLSKTSSCGIGGKVKRKLSALIDGDEDST